MDGGTMISKRSSTYMTSEDEMARVISIALELRTVTS